MLCHHYAFPGAVIDPDFVIGRVKDNRDISGLCRCDDRDTSWYACTCWQESKPRCCICRQCALTNRPAIDKSFRRLDTIVPGRIDLILWGLNSYILSRKGDFHRNTSVSMS